MKPPIHLTLQPGPVFGSFLHLYIHGRTPGGAVILAEPLSLRTIPPEDAILEPLPTLSIDKAEAQSLMDSLWNLGVRPTDGHGSTGQLAAVESHLAHTSALLAQVLPTVLNQANAHTLGTLPPTVRTGPSGSVS